MRAALLLLGGCPWIGPDQLAEKLDADGDEQQGATWGGPDCNDDDPRVYDGATDLAGNDVDEDCDDLLVCWPDADGDGYLDRERPIQMRVPRCPEETRGGPEDSDCDDADDQIHPGMVEAPGNLVDEDCDGVLDCWEDADVDGHAALDPAPVTGDDADCTDDGESTLADDCDDTDPLVFPGAPVTAGDPVDDDCDGRIECWADGDGDGFGNDAGDVVASNDAGCDDPGEAADALDCDDADRDIHPGATEVPGDALDQDCDGVDHCWFDGDGDGFGDDLVAPAACDGTADASVAGDCDDTDGAAYPGSPAADLPADGADPDCDGDEACYVDGDGDSYGSSTTTEGPLSCAAAGVSDRDDDCDDTASGVNPAATDPAGDGVDQDCDGAELCFTDGDGDLYAGTTTAPSAGDTDCADPGEYAVADDCDDTLGTVHPGATEISGNLADEDCDGAALCPLDDADGDGVCNGDDVCPGGDDTVDTDGDAVPNDCDGAPSDADQDDDSLDDGREVADGTLPNAPDSDADGICDGPRADNDGNGIAPPLGCTSVWYVKPGAALPIDGFTWDSAFAHPQDAIEAMGSGQPEEAWVAEGSYSRWSGSASTSDPVVSFDPQVALYGGFAGTEAVRDDRDPFARPTILDGDTDADGANDPNDAEHVVLLEDGAVLDGFVVRGGYADGAGVDESGGGLLHESGTATVADTRFEDNLALGPGGAIRVTGGDLTLQRVDVVRGMGEDGGGVHADGDLTWLGGALQDCEATGTMMMVNGRGGGAFIGGPTRLERVVVTGNQALEGGGLFAAAGSDLDLVLVDLQGNSASGDAGGLLAGMAASVTVVSSTIAGNSAGPGNGGGLVLADVGTSLLHGVTVADHGADVGVRRMNSGTLTIENSAFWGNGVEIEAVGIGGTTLVSSSCVDGGYAGNATLSSDPYTRIPFPPPYDDAVAYYLNDRASPCADSGDDGAATTAYGLFSLDWTQLSTQSPFVQEGTSQVDVGRHYEPTP